MPAADSPQSGSESSAPFETAGIPAAPEEAVIEAACASHEALFDAAGAVRCDACGTPLPASGDAAGDGYDMMGRGTYLWTRGDDARFDHVPLCPSCASAIGMTALARWEIEEEEG